MKALFIVIGALVFAQSAAASPCGDRIARLQAQAGGASAVTDPASTSGAGAETADAKLHHQPTAATAGDASGSVTSEAALRNARFQNDLFQAQAANDSGDAAACEAAVAAAERERPR